MANSDALVSRIRAALGDGLLGADVDAAGSTILIVDRGSIRELCRMLRDGEEKFIHLSGVCGVDYLAMGLEPRFAVVYHLYSPSEKRRLTVKVPLEEDDPVIPSVVEIFRIASFQSPSPLGRKTARFLHLSFGIESVGFGPSPKSRIHPLHCGPLG